jgi:WD40 repeat protein
VAFSPDGARLASASRDGLARVWDLRRERLERTLLGHAAAVAGIAFAPEGTRLASWDVGGGLRVWDLAPTASDGLLGEHGSYVYAIAHTPDGERILSGSWDGTIGVWDAKGGTRIGTLGQPPAIRLPAVTALAISPDARLVAVGAGAYEDAVVRVLRADTGTPVFELEAGRELQRLAWSPDGALLAFANDAQRVAVVDAANGRVLWDQPGSLPPPVSTAHLRFTADGRGLLVCGPRAVRRFDAANGDSETWLDALPAFRSAAFSADLSRLVTGHPDGLVRIWDTRTGNLVTELPGHAGPVYSLAFSPDESRIASGSDDATVRLRDPLRGEDLLVLTDHDDYVYALSFAPDGASLASGSGDGTVRIFDTRSVRDRVAAREARAALRAAAGGEVEARLAQLGDPDAVAAELRADARRTPAEREAALQALLLRLQER